MLGIGKSFQPEFGQIVECTSEVVSYDSAAMYLRQFAETTENGTHVVEISNRRRDLILSALSLVSLVIVVLLTACSPFGARLQSGYDNPAETPFLVLKRDPSQPFESSNLPLAKMPQADLDSIQQDSAPRAIGSQRGPFDRRALEALAKEPAVHQRVRLILGWMEFFRVDSLLPGLNHSWSLLNEGRLEISESGLEPISEQISRQVLENSRVSLGEFRLWRELLRSSLSPEQQVEKLDVLAWQIALAERPEDLQDLERTVMTR
jgi:hypothetical protein